MYIKKILLFIVLLGLLIAAFFAYYVYNTMFVPNTTFNNEKSYIYIASDDDFLDIKNQLEPLLKDLDKFEVLAKRKKYVSNIRPGRYAILKDMNNNDIINSLRSKNLPVKVSFNNQETLEKLAGRIAVQIEADSLSLINVFKEETFYKAEGIDADNILGMYIPNSYEFFWNTSATEFRARMFTEYQKFWKSREAKLSDINLNAQQVGTLASIVHEESKQRDEQPVIAGVYMNRLRIGMPLQADPTLKFAAYQLPQYDGVIIKRVLNIHKSIDSPYNTYLNKGLPPGPIAMPDISAIDAVLNYQKHDYLYFAADAERIGYHRFAKTLQQHNANARAYQSYLSQQGIMR